METIRETEIYFLHGGYGSIDLKGGDFESILYFKGKPYAILWGNCRGSIGQYLVRTGIKAHKKEIVRVRHILENGLDPNKLISEQIELVLKLFKYGELHLINYKPSECHIIDTKPINLIDFYPFSETYILTQARVNLNTKTIEKYKTLIKSGKSPVTITTSTPSNYCSFVIDGHHKLEAYDQLNQSPNILNIEKPYTKVPITEGERILKNDKESLILYKKLKVRHR